MTSRGSAEEVLFASTTPGLEPALLEEVRALGLEAEGAGGGVTFTGPAGSFARANLWLRTASRVLLRVGRFSMRSLERDLARVSLSPYWDGRSAVQLEVTAHRSSLSARQLESSAARAFRLPSRSEGTAALGVWLRLEGDEGTVSVDTSGELLHVRGYRQEVGRAPMRETLAAGMLRLAGHRPALPLMDPMCGSGTLLIEGALAALHLAPGAGRRFAFERFPSHRGEAWQAMLAEARAGASTSGPALWGSDIHAGALGTARRNARRAGVLSHLRLERLDATALAAPSTPQGPGLVVANLPYGLRVGDKRALGELHRKLGAALRRGLSGWRFGLLVADPAAESELGLACERRLPVSNGGLRCWLLVGQL